MSRAPTLAAVPRLAPRPQLRGPVTLADARAAHPYNAENAARWLRAVAYLRDVSSRGWVLDTHDFPRRTYR